MTWSTPLSRMAFRKLGFTAVFNSRIPYLNAFTSKLGMPRFSTNIKSKFWCDMSKPSGTRSTVKHKTYRRDKTPGTSCKVWERRADSLMRQIVQAARIINVVPGRVVNSSDFLCWFQQPIAILLFWRSKSLRCQRSTLVSSIRHPFAPLTLNEPFPQEQLLAKWLRIRSKAQIIRWFLRYDIGREKSSRIDKLQKHIVHALLSEWNQHAVQIVSVHLHQWLIPRPSLDDVYHHRERS